MSKLIFSIILLLSATSNLKAQFFTYSETPDKRPVICTGGNSITADGDLALASLITDPTVIESLELSDLQKTELQKAIVDIGTANQDASDKACALMQTEKRGQVQLSTNWFDSVLCLHAQNRPLCSRMNNLPRTQPRCWEEQAILQRRRLPCV